MPKFIQIIGPQAVGKMTVGQELAKITEYKLLYNHMTIEMVRNIFDYDKEAFLKEKQEVEKKINKAKSYESHLLDCKENLEQFFQLDEKISRSMDKMYLYSKRRVDLNGSDMEAQELYQLVKKLDIFYENTVIFLKPMLLENKEKNEN